jgi:hypothetical protein
VGRLAPTEWLRGAPPPDFDPGPLTVLCPKAGTLSSIGRDGLFLLHERRESENWELVELAWLDDEEGAQRLAAFREFLRIEAVADPARRLDELRRWLRGAVLSDATWTRAAAANEYAALAEEFPESLTADDAVALSSALSRTRERALRRSLQAALDACPAEKAGAAPRGPVGDSKTAGALAEATTRFNAKGALPQARRQAVLDAAVNAGAAGAPLFARALDDADPTVREAGVAAAGQLRVLSLEPRIAGMLSAETAPGLRRTLVLAAGHLRSSASVPTLALLARQDGALSREAAFALARIRDEPAVGALRKLRSEATDKERTELFDFLLSDGFVAQERALSDR